MLPLFSLQKPIQIENWIDFGATTASFYRKQATETIVVNIPYSCIQTTEADNENCLVYVVAKHLIGFRGISMLAFLLSESVIAFLGRELYF